MAAGLNVIPITTSTNAMCQQIAQALRNLQVGRRSYEMILATVVRAVQASGGSADDLASLTGLNAAQSQILHDEMSSFGGHLGDASLTAAWDQVNAILGISV